MDRSTVNLLHRTSQAFCSQICEKETLASGIAYYCKAFAGLSEVNQFREVVVEDEAGARKAFDECEQWFTSHGLQCNQWTSAAGCPVEVLGKLLTSKGFHVRTYTTWRAVEWSNFSPSGDVRIVPARAMRQAFRATFVDEVGSATSELVANAYLERLDDPSFDMFVAMVAGKPVGRCAFYQVGDIGRVMCLDVIQGGEVRDVYVALLGHVLAMAKRLAMRVICAQVEADDTIRSQWLSDAGFVCDDRFVEFQRGAVATKSP